MHILILCNNFLANFKEATKITITEFSEILAKKGHKVTIIAKQSIFETLKEIKKRKEELKDVDVIHGFSAAPLLVLKTILVKFLYLRKARTVQTLKSYSKKFLGSLWFSYLLNFVNIVSVSTQEFKRKLESKWCSSKKIHVVHSPINLQRFKHLEKDAIKKKYGFTDKKVIFYYGSFYRTKGVRELILASKDILLEEKNTHLLICPRHAVDSDIQELVEKEGIKEKVIFEPSDVDIVEYLNMAEVLVLPYISMEGTEGNPSCLLEAMACRVPVVTSDFAELREVGESEKELIMVKPGDIKMLGEQIKRVLHNKELAKKLTENAYKRVKDFDKEKIAEEFLKVYEI